MSPRSSGIRAALEAIEGRTAGSYARRDGFGQEAGGGQKHGEGNGEENERRNKVARLEQEVERLRRDNLRWQQVCATASATASSHTSTCNELGRIKEPVTRTILPSIAFMPKCVQSPCEFFVPLRSCFSTRECCRAQVQEEQGRNSMIDSCFFFKADFIWYPFVYFTQWYLG